MIMTETPPSKRARLVAELKNTFLIFVYLALFLGAFSTYRRLLLAEFQITYFHYGCSVLEAMVLAKVIVLGSVFRIGERFSHLPLVVPVLYKTLCFSFLILVFAILEALGEGWFRGERTSAIFEGILNQGTWELLTRVLVKVLALVPLFAFWEMGRVLGDDKLFGLYFVRVPEALSESKGSGDH